MSWIKENKLTAGVCVATGIISVGLLAYGFKQGGAYSDAKASYEEASNKQSGYNKMALYPTKENQKKKSESVKALEASVAKTEALFKSFAPQADRLKDIKVKDFVAKLDKEAEKIQALFASKGITQPEGFALGFEKYRTGTGLKEATTGELSYQLDALSWLSSELASSGITELNTIYRYPMAIEGGAKNAAPKKPKKSKGRKKGRAPKAAATTNAYQVLPVEILFKGSEEALREFLPKLANSKEYFFRVKYMRMRNSNLDAPSKNSAQFLGASSDDEEEELEDGEEITIEIPDDGEAEEEAPEEETASTANEPGRKVVAQVLGKEALSVAIKLELLLFPAASE